MLLETLDLRNKDVLIYSRNKFNFADNFKIVDKNSKRKVAKNISYFDVCTLVKDPSPKNLIVYRLLTNVNSLDAYSTKYGYFIKINGNMELVYFDPIFAIKDLRHLRFDLDPDRFRFKIQQVGLTSLTKKDSESNFADVYSFDMKAIEAQYQNDKIYADAIFAFDDFIEEELEEKQSVKQYQKGGPFNDYDLKDSVANLNNISEDRSQKEQKLSMPNSPNPDRVQDLREEIIDLLKQALGIEKESANEAIKPMTKYGTSEPSKNIDKNEVKNLLDLFKSTTKLEELNARERESVVLKFNKQ